MLQMRIFFLLTAVAVVVVTILVAVALWYVIRIVRRVDGIVRDVEAIARRVQEGVSEMGELAEEGMERIQALLTLVGGKRMWKRRKQVHQHREES